MGTPDDNPKTDSLSDLEREVRRDRKFTLAEAIGRMGGSDMMKGASPVTLKRQSELEIREYLNRNLPDAEGALRVVLLRRVVEGRTLIDSGYEQPLVALHTVVGNLLKGGSYLEHFVREVDIEWGRANYALPHFDRPGQKPHPDDPYTTGCVSERLKVLSERLSA